MADPLVIGGAINLGLGLFGAFSGRGKRKRARRYQRQFELAQARLARESAQVRFQQFQRAIPGQTAQFQARLAQRFGTGTGSLSQRAQQEFQTRQQEEFRLAQLGVDVARHGQRALVGRHKVEKHFEKPIFQFLGALGGGGGFNLGGIF